MKQAIAPPNLERVFGDNQIDYLLQRMTIDTCYTEPYAPMLLAMALEKATESPAPRTQVGAVLTSPSLDVVLACNDLVPGVEVDLHNSLESRKYMVHAERSAIFQAAKMHRPIAGSILFAPWAACSGCAQAIAMSDVAAVVAWEPMMDMTPPRWKEEVAAGRQIIESSGTEYYMYSGGIDSDTVIRFDGKDLRIADV